VTVTEGTGAKDSLVMHHLVSLTYRDTLPPSLDRFVDGLLDGHLVGHRCPLCSRVYVPPRGYCPLCVTATGPADETEVTETGILTAFTIVTPVAYYGQTETEPFVHASVLLDGADTPLVGVDITGISHEKLRMGMRVRAIWRPPGERTADGISSRGWGGLDSVITSFEPTGEPDAPPDQYTEHMF
jgi:uncharacterized OB-fold protein